MAWAMASKTRYIAIAAAAALILLFYLAGHKTAEPQTVGLDRVATDGRLLAFVLDGRTYVIDVGRRSLLSTIPTDAVGVFLWGGRLAAISLTPDGTAVYIYNNLTAPALIGARSYPGRLSGAWLSDGVVYLVTAAGEVVHVAAVDLAAGRDREVSIPTALSPLVVYNPQTHMGRQGLYVASMRSGYEEAWAKGLEAVARHVSGDIAEAIYTAIRRKDLLRPIAGLEPEGARAAAEAARGELRDRAFRDFTVIHVVDKSLRYRGHVEVPGLVASIEEVGDLLVVVATETNYTAQIHRGETEIYVRPSPAGRHVNIYLISIPSLEVRSLTGLAKGEVARAARTTAGVIYLSTENTLYAINLTNLKVLGSLKTHSYRHLYPLSKDFLLAVGDEVRKLEEGEGRWVAEWSLKITLLDVRNPEKISERAHVTFVRGGTTGGMALCQNNTLLIPVTTVDGVAAIEIRHMRVKTVLKRANRAVCIEDTIYAISRDSIKIYDSTLKEVATIRLT
ncbi:MAG: beta-propeller domain-containing protein [Pyrobaculum sp.]